MFSAISWAAVYFVIWWTTLFAVLPFAANNQPEGVEMTPGTDAGAPPRVRIGRTFLITTIAASVIFAVFYVILTRNLVSLDDIPFLPRFDKVN